MANAADVLADFLTLLRAVNWPTAVGVPVLVEKYFRLEARADYMIYLHITGEDSELVAIGGRADDTPHLSCLIEAPWYDQDDEADKCWEIQEQIKTVVRANRDVDSGARSGQIAGTSDVVFVTRPFRQEVAVFYRIIMDLTYEFEN